MAEPSIPDTRAEAQFVQLADAEGRLVLLPAATVQHFRMSGMTSINVTIDLSSAKPARPWLTVTEAAHLHLDDVDGMTLKRAKVRISRACDAAKIVCRDKGTDRRIEPDSFSAWRLAERESNLDDKDFDHVAR